MHSSLTVQLAVGPNALHPLMTGLSRLLCFVLFPAGYGRAGQGHLGVQGARCLLVSATV